jgi:hypothetical protein
MSEDQSERTPEAIARDESTSPKSNDIRFRSQRDLEALGLADKPRPKRVVGNDGCSQRAASTSDTITGKVPVEMKRTEAGKPMDKHLKITLIVCVTVIIAAYIMRPTRYRISESNVNSRCTLLDSRSGKVWRYQGTSFVLVDR